MKSLQVKNKRLQGVLLKLKPYHRFLRKKLTYYQTTVLEKTNHPMLNPWLWPFTSAIVAATWMGFTTFFVNEDFGELTRSYAVYKQVFVTLAGSWPFIWFVNKLIKVQYVRKHSWIRLKTFVLGWTTNVCIASVVHVWLKGTPNPFWSVANSAVWAIPGMLLIVIPAYNALAKSR